MTTGCLLKAVLFTLMLATIGLRPAFAQLTDYDVKAAMLMNFGLYIERADAALQDTVAFTICHVAPESFDSALRKLKGRTVKNRVLEGRAVRTTRDIDGCDILFLGDPRRADTQRLIVVAQEAKALTVVDGSDIGTGTATSAAIGFGLEDKKIVFSVDMDAVRQSGYVVSSRLLKLAKQVTNAR
jgi:hypothetical protein